MTKPLRPPLLLAAGVLAAGLTGCAGFRAITRGAMNSERTGVPAPALTGDAWVGAAPDLEERWYLVAFLRPT